MNEHAIANDVIKNVLSSAFAFSFLYDFAYPPPPTTPTFLMKLAFHIKVLSIEAEAVRNG